MTDHPAPNPNQPDALVEAGAQAHRDLIAAWGRGEANCDHEDVARAVLAAVLPEVERHAKADALREAARDAAVSFGWKDADDADRAARWLNHCADQIAKGDDRG